jgi:hypothetical protein
LRARPTIEPRFFETYHYADVITTVVEDGFDHLLLWDEFFCDGAVANLVAPYKPESAFHQFIGFVIDRLLYDYTIDVDLHHQKAVANSFKNIPEAIADLDPFTLPVERALRSRRADFELFVTWLQDHGKTFSAADSDDVYDYYQDLRLCGPYDDLITQCAREVFFTLFTNRTLLLQFNAIVAQHMDDLVPEETDEELIEDMMRYVERPGVLRRAYMPEWVRRAVFFRDHGRCVGCHVDLSGIVSVWSEENFDHMVPLASGGLNDVTNIQLLCAACNQRKADGVAFTSGVYEDWYPMPEVSLPESTVVANEKNAHFGRCARRLRSRTAQGSNARGRRRIARDH